MQCTGVLARNHRAEVFHGRNMDIGLVVANITAQARWMKGGAKLLETTQFLGYVGVHTGMRAGGWTVQANERVVLEPGPKIGYKNATLLSTAEAFAAGHQTVGGFLRGILLQAATFEEALPLLEHTPLASPMYLVVGGRDTSAVITRGRDGPANVSQDTSVLGRQPVPRGAAVRTMADRLGEWYQVQTKWDPWIAQTSWECEARMANFSALEEKFCEEYIDLQYADVGNCSDLFQLYSDGRSQNATASMNELNPSKVDRGSMMAVMSKPPVLNSGTRFTSIMSAAAAHYETTVRTAAVGGAGGGVRAARFLMQRLVGGAIPELAAVLARL